MSSSLTVPIIILAVMTACSGRMAGGLPAPLTIAQDREPMSLNAALLNGASAAQWGLLMYSYLLKFNERGELVGDVATQVPSLANGGISKDGLRITYHLHKGVRFWDGAPLTARDTVYSINAVLNPRNNVQSRFGYDQIATARAKDDFTLELRMKRAFAPALAIIMTPSGFPILPAHTLAKYPEFNDIDFNVHPVGSGPYKLVQWTHGDNVTLEANPTYWHGRPQISRMVIRFIPNPSTIVDQLRTHEIASFFNADPIVFDQLRRIEGQRVTKTPMDYVGAIIFNTADPVTEDPRVRHALAEAIDISRLIARVYHGALTAKNAGRGLFMWAYNPLITRDTAYDPDAARRLLAQAGWSAGRDGIRRKNGKQLEVLLILQAQAPADAIIANAVAEYERAVGVLVQLKSYRVEQLVAPVSSGGPVYGGKFQMALYPFNPGDDPDTTDQFSCANVPPHGYNKSRICDKRIDTLLKMGNSTFDKAKRQRVYDQLQRVLQEQMPLVLLYQGRQVNSFTDRLKNQSTSVNGAFWNAGAWKLP
ncbi:MAG: peptide ABC transporter substrate-binding protein [Candidatus Eremiobacteraeota bacterium]|nr:peptide ABC transporter substrate-binding protein [Candidatus Eremiobacteraeota bacterium]